MAPHRHGPFARGKVFLLHADLISGTRNGIHGFSRMKNLLPPLLPTKGQGAHLVRDLVQEAKAVQDRRKNSASRYMARAGSRLGSRTRKVPARSWRFSMRISHRSGALTITALTAAAMALSVAPAHAISPSDSGCLTGYVCIWSEPDFTGTEANVSATLSNCNGFPFAARSAKNEETVREVTLFSGSSCNGTTTVPLLLPGQQNPNFPASLSMFSAA